VLRYLPLLAGLGALFVAGAALNIPQEPGGRNVFLDINNQRDVLWQVSINGILAVGMTLVILSGGIDLSVGSVMSLCTVVCAMLLMERPGADYHYLSRAHVLMLPAVALCGALVGYGLVRRLRRLPAAVALVAGGVLALAAAWLALGGPHTLAPATALSSLGVLLVVPLVGGMMGLLSGVIIAKTRLQPFIVTLAMMVSAVGLAKFIAGHGGQIHTIYKGDRAEAGAPPSFEKLGATIITVGYEELRSGELHPVKLLPVPGLFLLGAWVAAAVLLNKYPLGRYVYAIGGNEEAARLAGVPVPGVKVFVYAASGLLAGLAAVLYCAQYTQGKADAGQGKELDAIAAVVIGGTSLMGGRGSIVGTLVGVMIFGYLTNILQLKSVSSEIRDILKGVIIVGAAAVQSGDIMSLLRSWFVRSKPT
jgi:ribose/xylose/arabinose/galactoside ABC-type transport system permease subunit